MTREEQISREATKYAEKNQIAIRNMLPSINAMTSFINSAKWADKTMLDKVCKWLEERQAVDLEVPNIEKFISTFRKAMEEQQ